MTEKTLETQFSDLINTHRKLGDESSLNNEIAYNRDWRTAVTSALSGDDKIDKGVAVEIVENLKNHLTYAEDWRNAVTNALLDGEGYKISHQRAIEIIKDLKTKSQEAQKSTQNNSKDINYEEVIKFLTNCSAQKDELDRLNKQCNYFKKEIGVMESRIEEVRKSLEDGRCQLVLSFEKG